MQWRRRMERRRGAFHPGYHVAAGRPVAYAHHKLTGRTAMTMGALVAAWAKLGAVGAIMAAGIANAAEIKVIGSPGAREADTLLGPGFAKANGDKVANTWG